MARYALRIVHPDEEVNFFVCSIQTCRKQIKHHGVEFMRLNRLYCVNCAKKMLQFDKEEAKKWLVEIEEAEKRLKEFA